MPRHRFAGHRDLFDDQPDLFESMAAELEEPPDEEFIDRIRAELHATLAKACGATCLPWDLTRSLLTEMRFNSIAGWLPKDEAARLRAAFAGELARLYAAAGQPYQPHPGH